MLSFFVDDPLLYILSLWTISVLPPLGKLPMNSRNIKHLRVQGIHSDMQYGCLFSRPTAEVLTIIPESVYQNLDKNHGAVTATSDILKAVGSYFSTGVIDYGFVEYDSL